MSLLSDFELLRQAVRDHFRARVDADQAAEALHRKLEQDPVLYAEHLQMVARERPSICQYGACRPTDIFGT